MAGTALSLAIALGFVWILAGSFARLSLERMKVSSRSFCRFFDVVVDDDEEEEGDGVFLLFLVVVDDDDDDDDFLLLVVVANGDNAGDGDEDDAFLLLVEVVDGDEEDDDKDVFLLFLSVMRSAGPGGICDLCVVVVTGAILHLGRWLFSLLKFFPQNGHVSLEDDITAFVGC